MSIIQNIRDKYARWAVIAIAFSLLGFILMDAFAGRTGLFANGQSNTLGKVNGKTIDKLAFQQKVDAEEKAEAAQGFQLGDEGRQQIIHRVWEQEVNDIIMSEEYEKLGLTITEKELRDILYGANPPQELKQRFSDEKGNFNAVQAQQAINAMRKDPIQKTQIDKYFDYLKSQRLQSKYMNLITGAIHFPKWFLEKRNADNSLMAKLSYVNVPYTSIPDSSIKVSDEEIKNYIKGHEDEFEQKEESRSISYVLFSAAPSAADSAAILAEVEKLKPQFLATDDAPGFVAQQGSPIQFFDGYLAKSAIQVPVKDSIFALPKNAVYGPYLDGNNYVLAKMIDSKMMPDSAKARHILIQTANPQTGQVLMADSIAKRRIDSVKLAIENGFIFDTLAKKLSDDKSSAEIGGLVQTQAQTGATSDYFTQGQMVKAFNDSVFNGKVGDRIIVKTEFGYHLIEILDLKNIQPHYKIAYLGKQIFTSQETDQEARNKANLFAGDSRDLNSFNANYEKDLRPKGYNKLAAPDITPMSYTFSGIQGSARSFVKKIFETDQGDVIGPDRVGDNYIVAIVTEVNKPGLQTVNTVRQKIEPLLKNKKKGEQIIRNIGQVSTLEQVASKMNQTVQALDSIRFQGARNLGYEPKVLGAAFNPNNKGKLVPEPIAGNSGVYVLRVDDVTTTPVEAANIEEQRKMFEMQTKQGIMSQLQQGYNPITETLKKAAKVKDKRADFY